MLVCSLISLDVYRGLKGIVHPKMKMSVIIYSPSSCSKPEWISFFCWTQEKKFWRIRVTKQLMDPIDIKINKNTMEVNGVHQLLGYWQITCFVFSRRRKFIHVWNKLRVSRWWQTFYFEVNYPFNVDKKHIVTRGCEGTATILYKHSKSSEIIMMDLSSECY